jgi:Asp-tRNA(Asn)/Glu-tRNA(Gln) amidotransferase A subunit family amidase
LPPADGRRLGNVFMIERWTDYGPLPPETEGLFRAAVARFADVFDADITAITPRELFGDRTIDDDWFTLCCAEHAHHFGREWYERHVEELHPSAQSFLGYGFKITIEDYLAARRRRFAYVRALDDLLGADGLVLSPVMTVDAFPAEGPADGDTGPEPYVTTAQNITGHPALSLPAGAYPSGVPFGLQITGPRFRDGLLLDVAVRWQERSPWPLAAAGYTPFEV